MAHPIVLPQLMAGQTHGRLTVLSVSGDYTVCQCICGRIKTFYKWSVMRRLTQSCGCLQKERASAANTVHGHSRHDQHGAQVLTPEYRAWHHAKARCFNPRHKRFKDWGGRGITMCEEWRDDFAAFLAHIGPKPHRSMLLDRIDNNGNYEPGNVRWATPLESGRNTRRAQATLR